MWRFYEFCNRIWANAPKTTRIFGGVDTRDQFNLPSPSQIPISVNLNFAVVFDEDMKELDEPTTTRINVPPSGASPSMARPPIVDVQDENVSGQRVGQKKKRDQCRIPVNGKSTHYIWCIVRCKRGRQNASPNGIKYKNGSGECSCQGKDGSTKNQCGREYKHTMNTHGRDNEPITRGGVG